MCSSTFKVSIFVCFNDEKRVFRAGKCGYGGTKTKKKKNVAFLITNLDPRWNVRSILND